MLKSYCICINIHNINIITRLKCRKNIVDITTITNLEIEFSGLISCMMYLHTRMYIRRLFQNSFDQVTFVTYKV